MNTDGNLYAIDCHLQEQDDQDYWDSLTETERCMLESGEEGGRDE